MFAPFAVRIKLFPEQSEPLPLIETVGDGVTVMGLFVLSEQPFTVFVPVKL